MIDPIKKNEAHDQVSVSNTTGAQKNSDMEAEYVQLPSKGYFYKGAFKNITQLKVRKLNWEDEDILTTKSYYDNGTLFNEILKNCIVDENNFPAKDLVSVDRDAILWWLRIGAFGREYLVPHTCGNPECKHKYNAAWDLGGFNSPDYPEKYEDALRDNGYVTINLPDSGLECKLVAASTGRELEIAKRLTLKKEKEKGTRDYNVTGKLLSVITEAKDSEGLVYKGPEISKWLQSGNKGSKISMVDSRYIQARVKEIDLDVDTRIDISCPSCGHSEEGVKMAMSINFFWPEYATV